MKNKNTIIETAKQTIVAESNAIANLVNFLIPYFSKFHPGGALGKKLYLRVNDLVAKR